MTQKKSYIVTTKNAVLREAATRQIIAKNPLLNHQYVSGRIEQMQMDDLQESAILSAYIAKKDLYTRIVLRTIAELKAQNLVEDDSPLLQEGFWDSVQAGLGNLAGGVDSFLKKIKIKKEPKGWEQAQRIFARIAEEEGNDLVKDLVKAIDEEVGDLESGLGSSAKDSKFPVNKNRNVFFSGVHTIATTYDSIVAATEKAPGEKGHLPVPVANEIIEQLRIIVQKYIADTEREKGGMYASFGGGDAEEGRIKEESFQRALRIIKEETEEGKGEEINPDAEYEKIMRGKTSPVFERMGSMKAPLVIAGAGAALGALGWIAQCSWFQDWILELLDISKTKEVTTVKDITTSGQATFAEAVPSDMGTLKDGEGIAKSVTRMAGGDGGFSLMGSDASLDDLRKAALHVGGGDLDKGLEGIAALTQGRGDPAAALDTMKTVLADPAAVGVTDPSSGGTLWKLFSGSLSGKGGTIFATMAGNQLKGMVVKKVVKTITVQATKTTVTTVGSAKAAAAVSMISGAGAVLAGVGVSAIVAGATLAYIRKRAKKKSRMGTLQDLLSQLDLVAMPSVEVEPDPDEKTTVTVTLESGGINSDGSVLLEKTSVEIMGLTGDPDLENTGGKANMSLPAVPISKVPVGADSIDDIPDIKKSIEDKMSGLDLDSENVEVTVQDHRSDGEDPPEPLMPPVPVDPGKIEQGQHAVCVFGPDGARVWRILKKKTYRKYASDAKRSKDKDAPKFAKRFKNYDAILKKLRSDGIFVNADMVIKTLSQISSGRDGKQYRATYTRTRGDKKRKSTTGGYTNAGMVKTVNDIRKNILGANGRPPRGVNDHTVIYLIDDELVAMIKDVKGVTPKDAQNIVKSALINWSKKGKRPKVADLGFDDDVGDILKQSSLAEAFNLTPNRVAVVPVDYDFFVKVLSAI